MRNKWPIELILAFLKEISEHNAKLNQGNTYKQHKTGLNQESKTQHRPKARMGKWKKIGRK